MCERDGDEDESHFWPVLYRSIPKIILYILLEWYMVDVILLLLAGCLYGNNLYNMCFLIWL